MVHIVSRLFDYFIKSGLLWGVKPLSSSGYLYEIVDSHMKVAFYSYLSQYSGIVEEFLYGKPKPDIWEVMPTAKLLGQIEFPLPHLQYRNLELPPFTDEPIILMFVDWDLYSYTRMSSARRAVRRLIEPYLDKIREDYLNLIIIDVRRGVEEVLGGILGGLILRYLGLLVDITGNPGHGVYLPSRISRKYPDIIAWNNEQTRLLREQGIIKCGAFLSELSVISLYGSPPCQNTSIKLDVKLPEADELIIVGEVEPSPERIHGGVRQVETYDELGYSDITLIIAPEACRRTSGISCIDLEPPLQARFHLSSRVESNKRLFLDEILGFMTKSTLLLNIEPSKLLGLHRVQYWHDIATIPMRIKMKEIINYIK